MAYELRTIRGYDFYEVASAFQKAVRRADVRVAGYFALELWHSGYDAYVWKRLFTISAEDCFGIITKEIDALYNGYQLVNKGAKEKKGRIFVSKAVILLCLAKKSRDSDHLQNLVYDQFGVDVEQYFDEVRNNPEQIPGYTFDCHTLKGKKAGKTKADFFKQEFEALNPRERGLFDNLVQ